MNIVNWKNEIYSVHHEIIDSQHKKIFEILNRLFQSMSRGETKDNLRLILNELVEYSQYHFEYEEKHFCPLHEYNHKDSHLDQHKYFIEEVQKFQYEFLSGKKNLTMPIFLFLKDWVKNHIRKCDKGYCGLQ